MLEQFLQWQTTHKQGTNKQGTYISGVHSAAEAAQCSSLVLYLHALYLLSTVSIMYQPATILYLVQSFNLDLLYFLTCCLMKTALLSNYLPTQLAQFDMPQPQLC